MTSAPVEALGRALRAARPDDPALRTLSLATLVNTVGNGAFYTVSALYFTRVVGIRPAQARPRAHRRRRVPPRGGPAGRPPRRPVRSAPRAATAAGGDDRADAGLRDRAHAARAGGRRGADRGGRQRHERGAQRPDRHRVAGQRRPGADARLPAGGHQRRHLPRRPARRPGAGRRHPLGLRGRLRGERRRTWAPPSRWVDCRRCRRCRARPAPRCSCCATGRSWRSSR
nr:hypothetical protein [Angustibacter aerolatus]